MDKLISVKFDINDLPRPGDLAEVSEDEDDEEQGEEGLYQKPPVVKIIDFANVTFPGFANDDKSHQGGEYFLKIKIV